MPPTELVDYPAWCRSRELEPFGDPDDLDSMRCALVQWDVWELRRREWAAAHGVDEDELGGLDSAPWDPDLI